MNDLESHSMSSPLLPFDRPYANVSLFCTVFEILTLICQKVKTSRDLDHADSGGQFVVTRLILHGPNRAENLKTVALAVRKIFHGV